MTTDFLLTVQKGDSFIAIARTVKMKDELLDQRVIEKFEIERVYWERRGIDWGIVTELEIPKQMARNISYIHDYYELQQYDAFQNMKKQYIEDLAIMLLQRIIQTDHSIREISTLFDKDTHMPIGSGITLFYHLIARKIIQIDMFQPINLEAPLVFQSINEEKLKKVNYG